MADFNLTDPQQGWEYDLHSVYSAYIGHFQIHGVLWYEKTWGHLFTTFSQFLEFGWPVLIVTDAYSNRAHIVTRLSAINGFIKMVRTRFGETLPLVDNIIQVRPFENHARPMRHVNEYGFYKKLHSSLPSAILAAQKTRIRSGEPQAIRDLWNAKDKNFLAIDFEWSEKNPNTCLEWGYAALRSARVDDAGLWPPDPKDNYRKGHYIVSDYVDKVVNKRFPTYPWEYAFADSQIVSKSMLPTVIQAIIDSLASPESETKANDLVIVAHGISGDLDQLTNMKIRIPSNVLVVDTTTYERQLFLTGQRSGTAVLDPKNPSQSRTTNTILSLANLLRTMGVEPDRVCQLHNSGNDSLLVLTALQLLLEPETKVAGDLPQNGLMKMMGTKAATRPRSSSRAMSTSMLSQTQRHSAYALPQSRPLSTTDFGSQNGKHYYRRSLDSQQQLQGSDLGQMSSSSTGGGYSSRKRGGAQQRKDVQSAMEDLSLHP